MIIMRLRFDNSNMNELNKVIIQNLIIDRSVLFIVLFVFFFIVFLLQVSDKGFALNQEIITRLRVTVSALFGMYQSIIAVLLRIS
jgi:hypothetical protein